VIRRNNLYKNCFRVSCEKWKHFVLKPLWLKINPPGNRGRPEFSKFQQWNRLLRNINKKKTRPETRNLADQVTNQIKAKFLKLLQTTCWHGKKDIALTMHVNQQTWLIAFASPNSNSFMYLKVFPIKRNNTKKFKVID
jgi:hypothetical protein